jgi:phospholipid/cholesterol/gamma-HCH transport system permease protein
MNAARLMLRSVGEFGLFTAAAFRSLWRGRSDRFAVADQVVAAGNRSIPFVFLTLGSFGVIIVFEALLQASRLIGDLSAVGAGFTQLMVREFAPTIGALMLAARVGAGMAAEVGTMQVTDQVDALAMCGADPVDWIVRPRLWAGILCMPVVTLFGLLAASLTGALTARLAFGVPFDLFLDPRLVGAADLWSAVAKSLLFGATIPLVACHCGLSTRGGAEAVGVAATHAVVRASLLIVAIDIVVGSIVLVLV